jgi:hypothetical protein
MLALLLLFAAPFYIGPWKVTSAVTAPWSTADMPPLESEKAELLGKTVTFQDHDILGPHQFACKGPHYKLVVSPPDGLFQGMLEGMHQKDHSVDSAKVAAQLGFPGKSWKTLETGCGNELDFHFPDPHTIKFGLNNIVYTLEKQ